MQQAAPGACYPHFIMPVKGQQAHQPGGATSTEGFQDMQYYQFRSIELGHRQGTIMRTVASGAEIGGKKYSSGRGYHHGFMHFPEFTDARGHKRQEGRIKTG
jgi:hypothetical protein